MSCADGLLFPSSATKIGAGSAVDLLGCITFGLSSFAQCRILTGDRHG